MRIYGGDIASLESVADGVAQGEILSHRMTAMLHCDHVINLVFRQRQAFRDTAIFAKTGRA